jgi:hypothetical protein
MKRGRLPSASKERREVLIERFEEFCRRQVERCEGKAEARYIKLTKKLQTEARKRMRKEDTMGEIRVKEEILEVRR